MLQPQSNHFWDSHPLSMAEEEYIDQYIAFLFSRGLTQAEMNVCLDTENIYITVHYPSFCRTLTKFGNLINQIHYGLVATSLFILRLIVLYCSQVYIHQS